RWLRGVFKHVQGVRRLHQGPARQEEQDGEGRRHPAGVREPSLVSTRRSAPSGPKVVSLPYLPCTEIRLPYSTSEVITPQPGSVDACLKSTRCAEAPASMFQYTPAAAPATLGRSRHAAAPGSAEGYLRKGHDNEF